MIDIEKRIAALERKAAKLGLIGRTQGTQIVRMLGDRGFLASRGLKVLDDRTDMLVWSIGIGGLQQPKQFYFGWTIAEALRRAERGVAAVAKSGRR